MLSTTRKSAPCFATERNQGYNMNIQPAGSEAGFDIQVPLYAEVAKALERKIAEEWTPSSRSLTFWQQTCISETRRIAVLCPSSN
ncbi:unnamed protein product [Calypogeia fissa]